MTKTVTNSQTYYDLSLNEISYFMDFSEDFFQDEFLFYQSIQHLIYKKNRTDYIKSNESNLNEILSIIEKIKFGLYKNVIKSLDFETENVNAEDITIYVEKITSSNEHFDRIYFYLIYPNFCKDVDFKKLSADVFSEITSTVNNLPVKNDENHSINNYCGCFNIESISPNNRSAVVSRKFYISTDPINAVKIIKEINQKHPKKEILKFNIEYNRISFITRKRITY